MIEVTGTLDCQDLVRAHYLSLRPRVAFKVLGSLILIAYFWFGWYVFFREGSIGPSWVDLLYPGILMYLLGFYFVYIPWRARRTFAQQKSLQRQMKMQFSEDGLEMETEMGRATVPWSDYLRWREDKHLFLLYVSDPMCHVVPKRFLEDTTDIDRFRKMLVEKIG